MKNVVVVLALVAAVSAASFAGTIASVDSYSVNSQLKTDGFPVTTSNSWASKWTTDATVDSASLGASSNLGIPGTPASHQYSAVGWQTGAEYFSFTVALTDGYAFGDDVELIYGGLRGSSTGVKNGYTTVIVDGVETTVSSYSVPSSSYGNHIDDVAALLDGAKSVEVRFYGLGATASTGTYRIGDYYSSGNYTDMGLYGSVVAIPEPATMALLGLGALVLRRKK